MSDDKLEQMRSVSGGHTGGTSLSCFFKTRRRGEGVGYKTIADNIKVGCLPKTINLSRLDDGVDIVATFRQHQTKWHDSYRLQFNKTKLERAEKRNSRIEDNTAASKKFTRRSIEEAPPSTKMCFFCGMPPVRETLRNAKKKTHVFSGNAIDQAHEQNNASVKGDGGAVGLTENPAALRCWMVSGPEMARLIGEFLQFLFYDSS